MLNQNTFMDIRFSTVRSNFPLVRRGPGSTEPDAPYRNWSATYDFFYDQYLPRPANPTSEFFDERDTDNLNGTVSWYVTGEEISHDIKFGANYTWINYFAPFNYPNGYRRYTRGDLDDEGNPNWMVTFPDTGVTSPAVPVEVRIYGAPTDNNARLFKQGQDNVLAPYINSGDIAVELTQLGDVEGGNRFFQQGLGAAVFPFQLL